MDLTTFFLNVIYGFTFGSTLILIAAGVSLIFGVMGVLNFAHGGICMLGAYMGLSLLWATGNFWLALVGAPIAVMILGFGVEFFLIRPLYGLNPLYQLFLTFGLSLVLSNVVMAIWGGDAYSLDLPRILDGSITFLGMGYPVFRIFSLIFSAFLALALWLFITRSKWGLILRAGIHSTELVGAFGINISWVYTVVFSLGAGLAAISGVIIGAMREVNPEMDGDLMLGALIVCVIGGLGSFRGAVLGSLIIGMGDAFGPYLDFYVPGFATVSVYLVMVVILLLRPGGLVKEV
jgi:branched-subunit amino acid ABC-type transport system permease component